MLSRKWITRASLSTIVCCVAVAAPAEETLNGTKFLENTVTTRDNYISTAAAMAGVIATQNKPEQAPCVDKWIASNRSNSFEAVLTVMRQRPQYHPLGVILAVLQKTCGPFKYVN